MYTTQTPTAADHMAHIAAASRREAERKARETAALRRAEAALRSALSIIDTLAAEGATRIGFKICWDDHKQRAAFDLYDAEALGLLVRSYGEDAEVWGIRADGSYCGSVF
jgi:hypothetical protein